MWRQLLGSVCDRDLSPTLCKRFQIVSGQWILFGIDVHAENFLHELRISEPSIGYELSRSIVGTRVADDVSQIHEQIDVTPEQHSCVLAKAQKAQSFDCLECLHGLAK